ncbi:hypothetical protein EVJ58_g466 [Rhodofomes roseus]|uniref:DUF6534 domain-containing protein n=1 Tax=Rhodofomes roseus TaxID=34475 RepID=A0A4Y9Z3E5_9APHY|nr:hypothetical protein EVJ58_g466 [Rhodofomes roseus]
MSDTAADDPIQVNLGSFFLGNIADSMLFGVITVQTYNYLMCRASDSLILGILLSLCWIIDTLQLALFSHLTFTYVVTDLSNSTAIDRILWCFPHILSSDLEIEPEEHYTRHSNGGQQHNDIRVSAQTVDAFRSKEVSGLVYAGLINSVCGNVLIAASLYAILRKHLRAASNSRTSFIVRTLIAYSVETGATTSICALVCLIAYAVMQHNCIYIALYSILSKGTQ